MRCDRSDRVRFLPAEKKAGSLCGGESTTGVVRACLVVWSVWDPRLGRTTKVMSQTNRPGIRLLYYVQLTRRLAIARARPFTGDRHGRHGRHRGLRVRPARRYRRCGRANPTKRSPRSRPRRALPLPDTSKPSRGIVVVVIVVSAGDTRAARVLRRPASSRVRRASRMEGRAHDHARDAPDPRRIVLAGLRLRREWSHHARGGDG